MRFIKISGIARNGALVLGLALMGILSINAQENNTGNSTNRAGSGSTTSASTPRAESNETPRTTPTSTPRTEVQRVVEKENGFPWGLLGLLGLAGLIPKKRSVEVAGVRETTRDTRTASDNRDNRS